MNVTSNFVINDADVASISSFFQHLNNDELKLLLNDETSDLIAKLDDMIKNSTHVSANYSYYCFLLSFNNQAYFIVCLF